MTSHAVLLMLSWFRVIFGAIVTIFSLRLLKFTWEDKIAAEARQINGMVQRIIKGNIRDGSLICTIVGLLTFVSMLGLAYLLRHPDRQFEPQQSWASAFLLIINMLLWWLKIARYQEYLYLKEQATRELESK